MLRSEAAVRGPAVALERFERYRRELRDQLGADPGELLQHAHRSLLALDRPVRRGVRYDATELIGRDHDLKRLRALVSADEVRYLKTLVSVSSLRVRVARVSS